MANIRKSVETSAIVGWLAEGGYLGARVDVDGVPLGSGWVAYERAGLLTTEQRRAYWQALLESAAPPVGSSKEVSALRSKNGRHNKATAAEDGLESKSWSWVTRAPSSQTGAPGAAPQLGEVPGMVLQWGFNMVERSLAESRVQVQGLQAENAQLRAELSKERALNAQFQLAYAYIQSGDKDGASTTFAGIKEWLKSNQFGVNTWVNSLVEKQVGGEGVAGLLEAAQEGMNALLMGASDGNDGN